MFRGYNEKLGKCFFDKGSFSKKSEFAGMCVGKHFRENLVDMKRGKLCREMEIS